MSEDNLWKLESHHEYNGYEEYCGTTVSFVKDGKEYTSEDVVVILNQWEKIYKDGCDIVAGLELKLAASKEENDKLKEQFKRKTPPVGATHYSSVAVMENGAMFMYDWGEIKQ